MIQRIQSIFLLDTAVFTVLMLFFPPFVFQTLDSTIPVGLLPAAMPLGTNPMVYVLTTLTVIIPLLALFAIFQFKNRPLQMKLSTYTGMLCFALLLLIFVVPVYSVEGASRSFQWTAFMPLPSGVMAFLAARFIKRDEDLVRSADRLR